MMQLLSEVTSVPPVLLKASRPEMLLQKWCRLRMLRSWRTPCLHQNLSGFTEQHAAGGPPPTSPVRTWSPARPRCLDSQRPPIQVAQIPVASRQFERRSGGHVMFMEKVSQLRHYSTTLVKSVLKSNPKAVALPGKRVPKGPRTKQPSRTNQPLRVEDQVRQAQPVFHSSPRSNCLSHPAWRLIQRPSLPR